jgi:hypothetical protein
MMLRKELPLHAIFGTLSKLCKIATTLTKICERNVMGKTAESFKLKAKSKYNSCKV